LHTLPVSLRRSAWDSSGAPLFGGEPVLCHALLRSCALRLSSEWSEQHCCESGDKQFVHMRSPSRKTHRSVIREAMERAGFHRGTRFFPKFPRSIRNWIGPRHNLAAPVMTTGERNRNRQPVPIVKTSSSNSLEENDE
jgi:hypothetical protein